VRSVSAGRLLGQLFATTEAFGMETQPQLLLLQRSMVMVEGMALHLDHEANMWALSRPVIGDWMRDQLSPEVALADHVNTVIESLGLLPKLVRRASDLMEDLETKVRDEKDRPNPERMGLEGWPGIALLAAGAVILGWIVGRL
jgi:ubiquinone biosynthesis protein